MSNKENSKPVFKLKDANGNDQRYTVDGDGNLIPLVEEPQIKEDPWQAANTLQETCKILKLGRTCLMGLIKSGQLKAIKAGAKWLVPGWAIEEFIQVPK